MINIVIIYIFNLRVMAKNLYKLYFTKINLINNYLVIVIKAILILSYPDMNINFNKPSDLLFYLVHTYYFNNSHFMVMKNLQFKSLKD